MIWFYGVVALVFVISGLLILIKPAWMKLLMQIFVGKDLFYIPGVVEIGLGLGTLYFRNQTRITWFIYLAGLLMFFDGIFYIVMSKRLREMYEWFIGIEDQRVRSYGLFLLLLAVGYALAAIV